MAAKDGVGRYGERVAARYLGDLGLTVVATNWRSPDRQVPGELDIVAMDGATAVVVEVKTRRGVSHGTALDAVTPVKLARLRRLAMVYLTSARTSPTPARVQGIRIDVVAVQLPRRGAALVGHVIGVG